MKSLRKTMLAATLISAITLGGLGAAYAANLNKSAALEQATVSAQQAIEQAKTKFDGKVVEMELKHKKDALFYEVTLLQGTQKQEMKIDAKSGEVIGTKSKQETKHQEKWQALQQEVKISLEQAMDIAQQQTGGKFKEIEFKVKKGTPQYKVETSLNGKTSKIRINANTGEILQ